MFSGVYLLGKEASILADAWKLCCKKKKSSINEY